MLCSDDLGISVSQSLSVYSISDQFPMHFFIPNMRLLFVRKQKKSFTSSLADLHDFGSTGLLSGSFQTHLSKRIKISSRAERIDSSQL